MNTSDLKVFNPGVHAPVKLTLSFERIDDAAWVVGVIVAAKRDGVLRPLMAGILQDSLLKVAHPPVVEVNGKQLSLEDLNNSIGGRPIL